MLCVLNCICSLNLNKTEILDKSSDALEASPKSDIAHVKVLCFHYCTYILHNTYLDGIKPKFTWSATFFGAVFLLSPSSTVHFS